jgi:hypothetical protein
MAFNLRYRSLLAVQVSSLCTDEYDPTQVLTDVMTMREHADEPVHDFSSTEGTIDRDQCTKRLPRQAPGPTAGGSQVYDP